MRRRFVPATVPTSLVIATLLLVPACRSLGRRAPPREPVRNTQPAGTAEEQAESGSDPRAAETGALRAGQTADSVPTAIAAIIDSIEAVVRDSVASARRDSTVAAARRDSIAAATRDSIAAAARDSTAAAARRDSIAAVARRDSIEAAIRDSAAASTRRDSIAQAARLDSLAQAQASAPITEDLATLRALGPSYIPYDRGPRPVWDTEMQARVTTTLLPVIRAEELVARTRAYFWLLVRADGTVDQVVLQTSSGSDAFDEAAARLAREMLFAPAIRGGRAVPTWVVRDVSLIMQ